MPGHTVDVYKIKWYTKLNYPHFTINYKEKDYGF